MSSDRHRPGAPILPFRRYQDIHKLTKAVKKIKTSKYLYHTAKVTHLRTPSCHKPFWEPREARNGMSRQSRKVTQQGAKSTALKLWRFMHVSCDDYGEWGRGGAQRYWMHVGLVVRGRYGTVLCSGAADAEICLRVCVEVPCVLAVSIGPLFRRC